MLFGLLVGLPAHSDFAETGLNGSASAWTGHDRSHLTSLAKRDVLRLLPSADRKITGKGRIDPPTALPDIGPDLRFDVFGATIVRAPDYVLETSTSIPYDPRGPPISAS